MPAIVKAQTTKQAKAAFKARGRPSLSEKELRQLDRSVELDERAERAKEAEKRRAEAAKKRTEKERRDNAGADRFRLGSQRRYDRFGFKASQFHLGAFFSKPGHGEAHSDRLHPVGKKIEREDDDIFEDEDIDETILMEAMGRGSSRDQQKRAAQVDSKSDTALMPPPPLPRTAPNLQHHKPALEVSAEDMSCFWDELDSSTQIARDLNGLGPVEFDKSASRSGSFSSDEFDLTAEDLDALDPPQQPIRLSSPSLKKSKAPAVAAAAASNENIRATPQSFHVGQFRPCDAKPALPKSQIPTHMSSNMPQIDRHQREHPTKPGKRSYVNNSREAKHSHVAAHDQGQTASACERPHALVANEAMTKPKAPMSRTAVVGSIQHPPQSFLAPTTTLALKKCSVKSPQSRPVNAIRGPFLPASSLYCSPDLGFTLSQLEKLVDDDIQLTQAAPD